MAGMCFLSIIGAALSVELKLVNRCCVLADFDEVAAATFKPSCCRI
jgi:hypothetical protein